jgi:hypothetical protein
VLGVFSLALVACIAIAACGSSSSSSSTKVASTNPARPSAPGGAPAFSSERRAKLRACLAKQGVTLPSTPQGGQPGGGQSPYSGGAPQSASQTKLREAFKHCAGTSGFVPGHHPGHFGGFAGAHAALAKYAACMRDSGVDLPAPNTTGGGPVFDTKGIDTTSAAFVAAQKKCQGDLPAFFLHPRPGGGTAGGAAPGGVRPQA